MEAQLIKFYQTKSLYYFFLLFSGLFILFLVRINPFIGEGNGNPLQYSCLENPMVRGAWWAAVHRVAQSRTRLKWLSMLACIGEGNGNPLQYSCLENPMDRGAWWAAIHRVAQSWTRLKRLSRSSSSNPFITAENYLTHDLPKWQKYQHMQKKNDCKQWWLPLFLTLLKASLHPFFLFFHCIPWHEQK